MKTIVKVPNVLSHLNNATSRRSVLKRIGLGAAGLGALALMPTAHAEQDDSEDVRQHPIDDEDILNFALNLEYLEAEFYSYATTGASIQAQGVGVSGKGTPGSVIIKSNPKVPFTSPEIQQYAIEIAADELDHVKLLRAVLGNKAVARPEIDLENSFTAAARAAGVIGPTDTFDPFAGDTAFLLGAFIFEDVGVTAYHGAAPLVRNKTILSAAAGLLGTEAYHAATVRTKIYETGAAAINAAQLISNLRDSLDGPSDDDQGVTMNDMANIVPTDSNGLVFARTVAQVLSIVYFSPQANKGGFFPNGINSGGR